MNTTHIDIGLARYSDWAFTSAMVVLVIALILLAVELAYTRSRTVEQRELVAAGTVAGADGPGRVLDAPKRPVDERIGRSGVALVYVGIAMLLACIVLRGFATMRPPWGNMYEFINLTCFCGLVAAAIMLRRPQYRSLWAFVLLPVLILLGGVGTLAVRQRRAGDARAAVVLAADSRLGGEPRLRECSWSPAWRRSCSW